MTEDEKYLNNIAKYNKADIQPTFDTEEEAIAYAVEEAKKQIDELLFLKGKLDPPNNRVN